MGQDNYYLLCFSDNHENITTYRIDKMDKVWVSEIDRTPHREYELFDTEEYCKQAFSMFGGEKQKVTLLFDHEILSEIFDRFGDDVRVVEQSEQVYSTDVKVQVSKPFFAWIVGTCGKVRIKSPQSVLNDFTGCVNAIKEAY